MQISVLKKLCKLKKINYTGLTKQQMMQKCGLSSVPKKIDYVKSEKPKTSVVQLIQKQEKEIT